MLHRIGPALVTLCVSALCISARMALASFPIEVGSVYDLDGFLVKRGTAGRPVYWLTSHRPGGARAADPWEVRLRDGSYPRALKSIHDEYTSEHRVIILGTGTPSGEIALDVMRPAFVPFVPTPELIKSVSVVDGVLKVVVVANNRISKEKKLLLRQGTIHHLAARRRFTIGSSVRIHTRWSVRAGTSSTH